VKRSADLRSGKRSEPATVQVDGQPLSAAFQNIVDGRIKLAIERLTGKQGQDITDIAKSLNLSSSRLRHLFKDELATSPTRFVKRLRLERARHLLEGSFFTVKEVMSQLGITDPSHFARDFKALYGHPPSQARWRASSDKAASQRQPLAPTNSH